MYTKIKQWFRRFCKKPSIKKLFEVKGIGILTAKEVEVKSSFKLEFYIGEQALLFFDLDMFSKDRQEIRNKNPKELSFKGELEDGTRMYIEKLYLISFGDIIKGVQQPIKLKVFSDISFNRKDFSSNHDEKILFRIANLEFTGCERTYSPHGGWRLDHFSINIEGYPIEVRQLKGYKNIEKALSKKEVDNAETAEIIVKANHNKHEEIMKIVNDLCQLMSFATGNTVVPFGEIHLKGKDIIHQIYGNVRTEPFQSGNHVIPKMPFETLPKFLEEAYPNYQKYKKSFGLDVILNYYELMHRNPFMDVRCVLAFVLLECLSNNAQEYYEKTKKPIESSLMKSKIKKLKKILPKHKVISKKVILELIEEFIYKYPTLQDSIYHLMKEFGVEYKAKEQEIFSLRKEFIHKGKFPSSVKDPVKTFRKIVHFIDRLILHMLGYTGEYLDISDGYKHKKLDYKT